MIGCFEKGFKRNFKSRTTVRLFRVLLTVKTGEFTVSRDSVNILLPVKDTVGS